ncbi:RING-H2 finger protein ATL22 [Camellia lanceoleosa]|uniref:RING-H2 finger protein ATL22 n=1 Tax=Camellia lanceoleosa TaxID=1840588 RepID=A0ACC0H432_9ERIC|nr:RING-H2 finger protein ATL22 [Camellia lanceoleosa]
MAAAATVVGVGGGAEEQDPGCLPTSCRKHHGPEIRFPFRLIGKQPERCGYPGFDLSCTPHSKYPVLELLSSVNVFVNNIDYTSHTINISDSEPHVCFPRQLPNLSPSASPFQFLTYSYEDVSFINFRCSFLPYEIFYYRYDTITFDHLQLNWGKPECGKCEAQGKNCGFKRNNNSSSSKSQLLLNGSTECFDKPRQPSTGALTKLKIAGAVLGPTFLLLVVIAMYHVYRSNKMKKADQKDL